MELLFKKCNVLTSYWLSESIYLKASALILSVLCLIINYYRIAPDHLSMFLLSLFILLLTLQFHLWVEMLRQFCQLLTNLPKGLILWVISPIHFNDLSSISLKSLTVKPMITLFFHHGWMQQIYYLQRNIVFTSSL